MSRIQEIFAPYWLSIQASLFPWIEEDIGPLTEKLKQLVETLEVVRIEEHLPHSYRVLGRPPKDRGAIARAFVAKAVYNMPTTRILLDRLQSDSKLRRVCGWETKREVPSESVFSRAFADFAQMQLPTSVHEALVRKTCGDRIIGHISRDSTAIEAREKPVVVVKSTEPAADTQGRALTDSAAKGESQPSVAPETQAGIEAPQNKTPRQRSRGRPRKGEEPAPKEPTRLQRQLTMSLPEMIAELPQHCSVGTKKNSKGYKESWNGYKLHIDTADGQIPTSCILTSASVHDSQVAIPLATMTAQRVVNLYDLMDAAYDAKEIKEHSVSQGHVPIIDPNPRKAELKEEMEAEARRRKRLGIELAEEKRYNERTASERVNARFKDEFGGRYVRVRGKLKVMCHCMFGILVLTADQLIRLIQ
jgi:hypothetical protein